MNGSITKHTRKNGRPSWGYCFRAGKDASGKWHQVTKQGFETKKEAEEALRTAITEHAKNPAASDPRTFAEFFDTWIREHCERHCEPTTVEGYLKKGAYAKLHFGDIQLTKLTVLQIESALNKLREHGGMKTKAEPAGRPLAPKTVREVAAVVNATFNVAIRWGVLDFNPMIRVTLPRMEKKEPKALEKSQLEWFLSGVEGHEWLEPLLALDAATGCRRGELLALQWTDIDFEIGALSVTKSLAQTKKCGIFIKLPKGRKVRRFSLPASTLDMLKAHRANQAKTRELFGGNYRADLDLVFATPEGEYLKPNSVTAKVSLLARKLGFPKGVSLHTLRHTHGSHLLSLGVPLPTVSKRLGHANTHITAETYSHSLERDEPISAEVWEKHMGNLGQNRDARKC